MIYDILPVNNYQGNSTVKTFDFDFYIENENQLIVSLIDEANIKTQLKYGIDYSINEFKNNNGSFITFPLDSSRYETLKENEFISLELVLPILQQTQYNNSSLLNLSELEYSFDYLTRLIQILSRKIELCIKVEECSSLSPEELMNDLNKKASEAKNSAQYSQEYCNLVLEKYSEILDYYNYILKKQDKFDLIDTVSEEIKNKSNLSLDNISDLGKNVIIDCNNLDNINATKISTTPTNNSTYTATKDGWFCVYGISTDTASSIFLSINSDHFTSNLTRVSNCFGANRLHVVFIPASKNDVVYLNYTAVKYTYTGYSNLGLWFIPKKGAQ